MTQTSQLSLNRVDYSYSTNTGIRKLLLHNIDCKITYSQNHNSFTTIVAPFGAGKSTLLKIICGILKPTAGEIIFNSTLKITTAPKVVLINDKKNYLPWLSVNKNIDFVLKNSQYADKKSQQEIKNIIELVGLKGYEDHIPNKMSDGFIFRIALANALIINPDFILLDEPFKDYKSQTRSDIYKLLFEIKSIVETNFLLATTNILEALYFSDMIYLMQKNPGCLFASMNIDRSQIPENLVINDYIIDRINEIQNNFTSKGLLEVINFSS